LLRWAKERSISFAQALVHIGDVMNRATSLTAKPLPLAERKSILAELMEKAPTDKIRRGMARIDLDRALTPREIAHAKTLVPLARECLARTNGRAKAA
jgi:hypothetical protein